MPLPMPPPSTLARPLVSVAQAVWPYARRLYQERQAGQMPLGGGIDLLDGSFDQTIARLCVEVVDDRWWRNLLNVVGHQYVAPEFLRIPALQEWLARAEVQVDIKALARGRVMGDDTDDQVATMRLRRTYAESTGENERLADGPINVVIAVVAAGHLGSIDRPQRPIAGMIQAGANENRAAFRQIDTRFNAVFISARKVGRITFVMMAPSSLPFLPKAALPKDCCN